jgi:hypothetical protein
MNGSVGFKPIKGSIRDWRIIRSCPPTKKHTGTYVIGEFVSHPDFAGKRGHTSMIVCVMDYKEGKLVETLNSRYILYYENEEPDREFWNMS